MASRNRSRSRKSAPKSPSLPALSTKAPQKPSSSSPAAKNHEKPTQSPSQAQPSSTVRNFAETAAGVTIGSVLGNAITASLGGLFGFLKPRQTDIPAETLESSSGQCGKEFKAYLESKEKSENSDECEQLWELFKQCELKNK